MDKIFSILDLAVSQISHSFFRNRFYRKSGAGLRENSARLSSESEGEAPSRLITLNFSQFLIYR